MRIGIGGVFQETNTYVTVWSGTADDADFEVLVSEEILAAHAGTGTEVGGAIAAAEALGVTLVPLLLAVASPGPLVARATYDRLAAGLLERLVAAGLIMTRSGDDDASWPPSTCTRPASSAVRCSTRRCPTTLPHGRARPEAVRTAGAGGRARRAVRRLAAGRAAPPWPGPGRCAGLLTS
jgi:hypothetical protein